MASNRLDGATIPAMQVLDGKVVVEVASQLHIFFRTAMNIDVMW